MRNTGSHKMKYISYAVIALLMVFLVVAGFFLLRTWEERNGDFRGSGNAETYLEHNGKEYMRKVGVETFLLLGLDKFEADASASLESYNNDMQADFLILLVFDNEFRTFSAVQINRDTMAKINILGVAGNSIGTATKQIALAHTYGNGKEVSCRNTSDAVSELLLGINVDHYMSVTMDAVSMYNDLLGGVEVTVLDDLTSIDSTLVKGETVTLLGEHALTYVRARSGLTDSTNIARMERQRQYLDAMGKKTVARVSEDDSFAMEVSLKIADYMVSDLSSARLKDMMEKFAEYEFSGMRTIDGTSEVGESFMEFYADEGSVKETVVELFYELKR